MSLLIFGFWNNISISGHFVIFILWQAILDKSGRDFFIQIKNSFFKVRVSIQVEIFFFMSRFKFISSREFFLTSRFLSQVEKFFSSREFFHDEIFNFF